MERCLNCMEIYDEKYEVCPHCGYVRNSAPKIPFCLVPGTVIGSRYIVGTVIGHGGFGITYRGWDTVLSTKIAIKEYFPSGMATRSPGMKDILLTQSVNSSYMNGMGKFLQEARTLASFNHEPSIVHVYDYLKENSTAYIVMEYIDGISLKKYVDQYHEHRLGYGEVCDIALKILKALAVVHEAGIVHRDISPDNVMMEGQKLTILDFGAARHAVADEDKSVSIILKKEYAPPEQFSSKGVQDGRTDIYALGVVMYRLLTGKLPANSIARMSGESVEPPSSMTDCPEWIDAIVMKAMSLDMKDRFQDAFEFASAITAGDTGAAQPTGGTKEEAKAHPPKPKRFTGLNNTPDKSQTGETGQDAKVHPPKPKRFTGSSNTPDEPHTGKTGQDAKVHPPEPERSTGSRQTSDEAASQEDLRYRKKKRIAIICVAAAFVLGGALFTALPSSAVTAIYSALSLENGIDSGSFESGIYEDSEYLGKWTAETVEDRGGFSCDFEELMDMSMSLDLHADGTYEGMTDDRPGLGEWRETDNGFIINEDTADEMELIVDGDYARYKVEDVYVVFRRK